MYWLPRPPYLRWAAAALLLLGALAWDLRPVPVETRPFAGRALTVGEAIASTDVEWREVPAGLLGPADPTGKTAAVDIPAGEPLTPSVLGEAVSVPPGWWQVPVDVGVAAAPGREVMLVVGDPPVTIRGLVISGQQGDPYSLDYRPALVAVPAGAAAQVAAAARDGSLVAAVAP